MVRLRQRQVTMELRNLTEFGCACTGPLQSIGEI
jgi:hypothetical protein